MAYYSRHIWSPICYIHPVSLTTCNQLACASDFSHYLSTGGFSCVSNESILLNGVSIVNTLVTGQPVNDMVVAFSRQFTSIAFSCFISNYQAIRWQ